MPIRFSCSGCGKNLKTNDESAGKVARCTTCGEKTRVPESTVDLESTKTYLPRENGDFPNEVDVIGPKAKTSQETSKARKRNRRRGSSRPTNKPLIYTAIGGGAIVLGVTAFLLLNSGQNDLDGNPDETPAVAAKTDDTPTARTKPAVNPKKKAKAKPQAQDPRFQIRFGDRLPFHVGISPQMLPAALTQLGQITVIRDNQAVSVLSATGDSIAFEVRKTMAGPTVMQIFSIRNWRLVGPAGKSAAALEHRDPIHSAVFSPDGKLLATGSGVVKIPPSAARGRLRLWDAQLGIAIGKPVDFAHPVRRVVFSPDGRLLVATASEQQPLPKPGMAWRNVWDLPDREAVHVLDAKTLQPIYQPLPHLGEIHVVQFSPDGKRLMTAGAIDRRIRLWEVASGKLLKTLNATVGVCAASMTPDGQYVVASTYDGMIRIWNSADGKLLSSHSVDGPAEPSTGIVRFAISPDGRFLATATWKDRNIRLWSLPSGKPHGKPLEHAQQITTVAFSPSGQLLLTAATQGSAQLWSVANGVKVGPPARYGIAGAAGFSRNGRFYFTAGSDGIRLWKVPTSKPQ